MTRSKLCVSLFLAASFPLGWARAAPPAGIAGDSCDQACPQTTFGWQLYTDPSRVPDFWGNGPVEIDELLICPHGIHFLFTAEQRGQQYLMALILIKPSVDLARERPKREWRGLTPEAQAIASEAIYSSILDKLGRARGAGLGASVRLDFRSAEGTDRPVLVPWSLTLRWRGREIPMNGYLDLYMTLIT